MKIRIWKKTNNIRKRKNRWNGGEDEEEDMEEDKEN